ncbi:hypothetical protein RvY_09287 [Ramazzottius varieornatus]|uniref:Uncharacterized protein n=1 Tax=Ramazzottius varieornatus TaxID=947166 RepID=A0A1D1VHY7_RAMVA|nr:hypothetical protein RvY_09287 [Ramazzottius varieornatus]
MRTAILISSLLFAHFLVWTFVSASPAQSSHQPVKRDASNLLSTSGLHRGYWTPFFQRFGSRVPPGFRRDFASDPSVIKDTDLQAAPDFNAWRNRLNEFNSRFDVLKRQSLVQHEEAEPIEFLG